MKLWEKGLPADRRVEEFTVGKDRELDLELAPYDVLGSLAHIRMLAKVGLLEIAEHAELRAALISLYTEISEGHFLIEEGVEDVHSQVELRLTRELGDIGKKIHSGRSRNDQVLVDLKLYYREWIEKLVLLSQALFTELQTLSETHKDVLLPGYTHFQVAMPSSFGLWFGAYAESLIDDMHLLHAAFKICNQNPLGSAAGYGSSFPLDRELTTNLLGFESPAYNVVYAQMGRGKTERVLAMALSGLAATLNKLASDVCLYMSQNFGFISFPDALTTGSSIMPHKKNPDVFELIRARTNQIQALPALVAQSTSNLPSGYHRDFQLLKEYLFPSLHHTADCLEIARFALSQIQVKENLLEDPRYDYIFSVEAVNKLVMEGVPFRDAYKQIAREIEAGTYVPDRNILHNHLGSIGNLGTAEIREKMVQAQTAFDFESYRAALKKLLSEDE